MQSQHPWEEDKAHCHTSNGSNKLELFYLIPNVDM